jgi:hypothetical protein
MEKQATVVLEEIRQLITQYRREVPSGRRAWPESIKARVAKLCVLGMTPKKISDYTELSYYTILGWVPEEQRRRYRTRQPTPADEPSPHFAPVAIRDKSAIATVTVAKSSSGLALRPSASNVTVTVTLPDGIRIEGVTPEFLQCWLGRGGGA